MFDRGAGMKFLQLAFALMFAVSPILARRKKTNGPVVEKGQKGYPEAMDHLHHRMVEFAFDAFKKADKQDGGHCLAGEAGIGKTSHQG